MCYRTYEAPEFKDGCWGLKREVWGYEWGWWWWWWCWLWCWLCWNSGGNSLRSGTETYVSCGRIEHVRKLRFERSQQRDCRNRWQIVTDRSSRTNNPKVFAVLDRTTSRGRRERGRRVKGEKGLARFGRF
ncbi:hypothetical protein M0804_012242 [Polistes exclamans]|nr:hypothetical protein M0804_012242 [Polistes exclamans]